MNIESLEISILKASEIKDGDIVLVRFDEESKPTFDQETIKDLYQKIVGMLKKEIPIYFFPKHAEFEMMKKVVDDHLKQEDHLKEMNN